MGADVKRYTVYSVREVRKTQVWVKAGTAHANRDGSINVLLDVLPLDGKLHLREPNEAEAAPPSWVSTIDDEPAEAKRAFDAAKGRGE